MPAPLLPALAHDLSSGDAELVARTEASLLDPPHTLETVGFYGTRGFPPGKNCFLFMITLLGRSAHLLSEEDKYVVQLFDVFATHIELPQRVRSWFPKRLGWDKDFAAIGLDKRTHGRAKSRVWATYHQGMAELEAAFEKLGTPLRLLQFHEGDTMPFIRVPAEVAERWTDVPIAHDNRGRPLGLTRPDWVRFYGHMAYAVGWDPDQPPPT